MHQTTINLLPDDYVARRVRRRANVMCLALFAVVMTGVSAAVLVSEDCSRHTLQVQEQVNASYAEAAKLIDQMQQLRQQKATLLGKAEQASGLLERVPRSYILGVVTNACPPYTSLLAVNLETREVQAGSDADKRLSKFEAASQKRLGKECRSTLVEMQITGLAATDVQVAKFIANLSRNPLLGSVDLVYSEEKIIDKEPVRQFQVKLELRPGLDVIDVLEGAKNAKTASAAAKAPALREGEPT